MNIKSTSTHDDQNEEIFYHFYDLTISPVTFNFVYSLIVAELARRELTSCKRTCMVFVPGIFEGGWNADKSLDLATKSWRFQSILQPGWSLIPEVDSCLFLPRRSDVGALIERAGSNSFPLNYDPKAPTDCSQHIGHNLNFALGYELPSLAAPAQARHFVQRYVAHHTNDRPFVTITLRESPNHKVRNSDCELWGRVCRYLQDKGFFVFVLPDYESVMDSPTPIFDGSVNAIACTVDLRFRTALYEQAVLNVGTSGGALSSAYLNRNCDFILSNLALEGVNNISVPWMESLGMVIGKDPSYWGNYAKLLWGPDDSDAIISECDEFFVWNQAERPSRDGQIFTSSEIFKNLAKRFDPQDLEIVKRDFGPNKCGPVFPMRKFQENGGAHEFELCSGPGTYFY